MPRAVTARVLGLQQFLDDYGNCEPDGPDLQANISEFDDWRIKIPFPEGDRLFIDFDVDVA